jgi:hypothetical protein
VFLRFKATVLFFSLLLVSSSFVAAQNVTVSKEKTEKTEKKEKRDKNSSKETSPDLKNPTAEQVAESAIVIYGGLLGRQNLNQIRKTTFERGRISVTNAEGRVENANYERWTLRGENLNKERVRFDQSFPNAKFALVYTGDKVFGVYNDSVFTPREDASNSFQHQIWHGLDALLRYKENDSKVELAGRDKMMGVDYFKLDVTDKQNRKTRFYISSKSFRVMLLEYESEGVKYRRKFYDYNYAQGTLVPYRSVLWANDKQVEEVQILTITFGQKVEESIFQEG